MRDRFETNEVQNGIRNVPLRKGERKNDDKGKPEEMQKGQR
jgi:hypothetical protein